MFSSIPIQRRILVNNENNEFIAEAIGEKWYVHSKITGMCVARLCKVSGEFYTMCKTETIPKCTFKKFKALCEKRFKVTLD
jgi:hypothetical protein